MEELNAVWITLTSPFVFTMLVLIAVTLFVVDRAERKDRD